MELCVTREVGTLNKLYLCAIPFACPSKIDNYISFFISLPLGIQATIPLYTH